MVKNTFWGIRIGGIDLMYRSLFPTQFLDNRIKFIFVRDNWIKLKFLGWDKTQSAKKIDLNDILYLLFF